MITGTWAGACDAAGRFPVSWSGGPAHHGVICLTDAHTTTTFGDSLFSYSVRPGGYEER